MPISGSSSDYLLAAAAYSALGYSVIPLLGDAAPDRSKTPAVEWKAYQSRRATESDFLRWFRQDGFQGIGIVTGKISNLIVMDFDDPDLYHEFCAQHPDLAELQVIQTRRGYHIYFQLPPYLHIQTRKGQGVELLAGGCYVVARPTTIAGFAYTLIKGGQPKVLSQQHINRIMAFLDQYKATVSAAPAPEKSPSQGVIMPIDPQTLYRAQVGQGKGRNQALFKVACTARDYGWSQSAVQTALVELHTRMVSHSHAHETETQRQREALNTIRSAFSKPARPPRPIRATNPQMPTRVREKLFALQLTCVVRTLEGLREKGIQIGQVFTRKQAHTLLKGIVGRDSINHALEALIPTGEPLVAREAAPPLEPPPAAVAAANETNLTALKNCVSEGTTKPVKIEKGRKPGRYIMPSNSQLVYRLGTKFSSSDPLQLDDLRSARKTRQATHRELLRRRPGQYYRHWLAARLGVSSRTTQRYDIELHVHVQPMFDQRLITWDTLNAIPDEPLPSMFLMDDQGRRYPAKREIAVRLLPKVWALYLVRQEANFYSLDEPQIALAQVWQYRRAQHEQLEQRRIVKQGRAAVIPAAPVRPAAQPLSGLPPPGWTPSTQPVQVKPLKPIIKPELPKPAPKLSNRRARQPLPDVYQEALAQRVYNLINTRTPDPQRHISQATARRCVFTYGTKPVENALKLLISRRNITHPVGFFVTTLRSESKQK